MRVLVIRKTSIFAQYLRLMIVCCLYGLSSSTCSSKRPLISKHSPAHRVAAMPWTEILMLTIGVALIVTMICTGQRA
jgi:hypothetical protein